MAMRGYWRRGRGAPSLAHWIAEPQPDPHGEEDDGGEEQPAFGVMIVDIVNLAMSLSLLKFVGQASLVDDAMLPS